MVAGGFAGLAKKFMPGGNASCQAPVNNRMPPAYSHVQEEARCFEISFCAFYDMSAKTATGLPSTAVRCTPNTRGSHRSVCSLQSTLSWPRAQPLHKQSSNGGEYVKTRLCQHVSAAQKANHGHLRASFVTRAEPQSLGESSLGAFIVASRKCRIQEHFAPIV